MKISFLMAAHNEEKIIRKSLNNLLNLPYKDYEVIIGLDGCTDNTEIIVKEYVAKSKKFKYFKLNLREGKPAVINEIIKKASGEIMIIHDSDWIFKFNDKKTLYNFLFVFNDKKIGGIAESFPVEWGREKIRKGNFGYQMVAYGTYFWFKFQKEKFSRKEGDLIYLKEPVMFLTNVFRKKLYRENSSLGDDFERTYDILEKGFKIAIFDDLKYPRMISSYDSILVRDFFKQKIRTAIARKQMKELRNWKIGIMNFQLPFIFYSMRKSLHMGFKPFFLVLFWIFLTTVATIFSLFKKSNTKEGWRLRARR